MGLLTGYMLRLLPASSPEFLAIPDEGSVFIDLLFNLVSFKAQDLSGFNAPVT